MNQTGNMNLKQHAKLIVLTAVLTEVILVFCFHRFLLLKQVLVQFLTMVIMLCGRFPPIKQAPVLFLTMVMIPQGQNYHILIYQWNMRELIGESMAVPVYTHRHSRLLLFLSRYCL